MEKDIWQVHKDDNVQVLGLDLWNGNQSQLSSYKSITKVTFPLLQNAGSASTYGVPSVQYIVVVDQNGTVRGIKGIEIDEVNTLIRVLLNPAPIANLKPKSLYYGRTMQVGQSKTVTVEVQNTGTADLEVTGVDLNVPGLLVDQNTLIVAPEQKGELAFTLIPTQEGTLSGTLKIFTNDPTQGEIGIPVSELTVEGALPPAIALGQTALDFGEVEAGRAVQTTVTVRNEGRGPLNVTGIRSTLGGISVSEQVFTVPAGESRVVEVTVTVESEGAFSGELQVLSDDPNQGSLKIPLFGTARIIPADPRTDFDGNGKVDFTDFLAFTGAFGGSSSAFDLNGNGVVDFPDFLVFVGSFGRTEN